MNPAFERYVGIDYSRAETPKSSLNGLRRPFDHTDIQTESEQPAR